MQDFPGPEQPISEPGKLEDLLSIRPFQEKAGNAILNCFRPFAGLCKSACPGAHRAPWLRRKGGLIVKGDSEMRPSQVVQVQVEN